MFVHIVMLNLKDADDAFHRGVESFATRIKAEVDDVVAYNYGPNVADRGKQYTYAVTGGFESSAAHDAYQASPAHQEMKAFMTPYIEDMLACDMEL